MQQYHTINNENSSNRKKREALKSHKTYRVG